MSEMSIPHRRIMMIIGIFGTAKGGHTWSFRTVHKALSAHHDISVVEISGRRAPELADLPGSHDHVMIDPLQPWRTSKALAQIIEQRRPQILHSFDARVDYFTTRLSNRFKLPLILTKCGGGAKRPNTFVADAVIVFNAVEVDLLAKGHGTGPRPTALIPNRVEPFDCDAGKIAELDALISHDGLRILRISRINRTYADTFFQGMNLCRRLNEDGVPTTIIIVGVVEDEYVVSQIKQHGGDQVVLITDPHFTTNAKVLIDVAQINIGTGRSLMEAAHRQRVLLTLQQDSEMPVLVTQDNFESLLATNFSPRNRAKGFSPTANWEAILKLCRDPQQLSEFKATSKAYFDTRFDVSVVPEKYEEIYQCTEFKRKPIIQHFSIQLRKIFQAMGDARRYKKSLEKL